MDWSQDFAKTDSYSLGIKHGKRMDFKLQFSFAHPSSRSFDRVLNWSERNVRNFYDLPKATQPLRFTPPRLLQSRAGPYRVESFIGVPAYATVEIDSIDNNHRSKSGDNVLADPISGAVLDVHL
jgi:hypothetical protein